MNYTYLLDTAADVPSGGPGIWMTLGTFAMMIAAMYFFILRPQKKQQKEAETMRNSINVGDAVVTTGGIMGIVVRVKDDMMLIETGADRTRIQIKRWAVHSVITEDSVEEKK